jgi:hypothetical protein
MPLEAPAKTLAEQMVRAARLPQHQPNADPWSSSKTRLAAACGLALLLLLFLVWHTATREPFVGSWEQAAAAASPAEAFFGRPRPAVALSFSRNGSFEGRLGGQDLSGRWKLVRRDGQTDTLELTTPGEPPRLVQATPLDDGRLRVSISGGPAGSGGPGTYNLSPANSGCS